MLDDNRFLPLLMFPNYKPPLLCVAPGFCAWVITNKAGIGHHTLFDKRSSLLISVVAVLHSHIPTLNTQQRPPTFSKDQQRLKN